MDLCGSQDLTDEQGAEAVKEAFKQGINFFDTSPYYGVTRSETVSASSDTSILVAWSLYSRKLRLLRTCSLSWHDSNMSCMCTTQKYVPRWLATAMW